MSDDRREENQLADVAEVESALRSLSPAGSRIDRDRLMYLAGQASVRPAATVVHPARRFVWPAATAAMALVAVALGLLLVQAERNRSPDVFNFATKATPVDSAPRNRSTGEPSYAPAFEADSAIASDMRLFARVRTHGINPYADYATQPAKPTPDASERPRSQRELIDDLLDERAPSRAAPSSFLLELFHLSGEDS